MRPVKAAIYLAITSDAALMLRLGGVPPYPGRLPREAPHSDDTAAITFEGETELEAGSKQDQTLTLHIWSYSHDLTEDVMDDLDRLFHPSRGRMWRPLAATGSEAFIRREFSIDIPDRASPLWHKAVRFRIKYAVSSVA